MAMPMQISLEEIISMLLSRVEALSVNDENEKTKNSVILRVLYKKGIITDADIEESIRDEHKMLRDLGLIKDLPSDEAVKASAENILQWARGDVQAIKTAMDEYEKKVREYAEEQQRRQSGLTVASADALTQLDRLAPPPGSGGKPGSKLIF